MSRITHRVHQAGAYFVTTHTWQRRELFRQQGPAEIVVRQLLECRDRAFYKLHAFVLMPDHLHVLLTPNGATTLESTADDQGRLGVPHRKRISISLAGLAAGIS